MFTLNEIVASNRDVLFLAGIISALVSGGISYWFKTREIRHSAKVAYEYEQRKKLQELIGRYHGRALSAANSMSYRFWNLYENHESQWLRVDGDYDSDRYYFRSTIYRFMNISTVARQFEREALLLDARIATRKDFLFLNYMAAFHWVLTDVALTKGTPYDPLSARDHFYSDRLRQYCDGCLIGGEFISIADLSKRIEAQLVPIDLLKYFDGLSPHDGRFRWDRLVAFHLLLLTFINTFGYKHQRSNQVQFNAVAATIQNPVVLHNLITWLPRHDLGGDREAKKIIRAARSIGRNRS